MNKPAPAEAIPNVNNEIIASREPHFNDEISLGTHYILCADKRGALGMDDYLHLLGAGLNVPYNLMILRETAKPGSVTEGLDEYAAELVPIMQEAGAKIAVHSDTDAEAGPEIRRDVTEGEVGCRYAEQRPVISRLIASDIEQIVEDAAMLRPELFENPLSRSFALALGRSHGLLAEREGVLPSGRQAVLAAAESGAKTAVVAGDSDAEAVGIINLGAGSIRSREALEAGMPAYVQDSHAAAHLFDRLHAFYPQGPDEARISELIDTLGTFKALGIPIELIAVRRPEFAEAA